MSADSAGQASPPDPAAVLARVRELYHGGLLLQAYTAAQQLGPLHTWQGTAARLLAGRLA